jgi:hypothetical protein
MFVMTDQQKYLLLGAIGVGGLAYWYFNYGPGATPVAATTTVQTQASVVPAATGANVPVPATVTQFVSGMGPNSLAAWNGLVQTLPASNIAQQYANINALIVAQQNGGTAPQSVLSAVYNWFAAYGMTNLKS